MRVFFDIYEATQTIIWSNFQVNNMPYSRPTGRFGMDFDRSEAKPNSAFYIWEAEVEINMTESETSDAANAEMREPIVVQASEIAQVPRMTGQVTVMSEDQERSVTVDAASLAKAYIYAKDLLASNHRFQGYGDLRELIGKVQKRLGLHCVKRPTHPSDMLTRNSVNVLVGSLQKREMFFELIKIAPDESDMQLALDWLFRTIEAESETCPPHV